MYDNIINGFLESDATANTIPVVRHKETKKSKKTGEEYAYYSFAIKGTKQKISPVTLRNKAREADPKIYVFTSGDEIGLVKIVDEAQEKIEKSLAQGIPKSIGKSESDFEKISNHLIRLAKPEIEKILGIYIELKEQSDKIAKEELLPLLQKYITNPI